MGARGGRALPARCDPLVRRQQGRVRPADGADGRQRRGHRAREAPELFPVPLRPQRRRPRRGPHLHQHAEQGRGGPYQQLDRRRRAQAHDARPLRRLYARTDDVCHPLLDGPAGFADGQDRRRDQRQPLRRLQHADHDPGRRQGGRGAGRGRRVRALPALDRRPARARARGRSLALRADGEEVHRPLPAREPDLVVRLRLRR